MRHRTKGRQLSRTAAHRRAMLRNMAASLFEHEGIETTVAKCLGDLNRQDVKAHVALQHQPLPTVWM